MSAAQRAIVKCGNRPFLRDGEISSWQVRQYREANVRQPSTSLVGTSLNDAVQGDFEDG